MGRISELMRAEIATLIAENRAKEKDEAKSSAQSLRDALAIGFGNADPAKFCLERFLSATGKEWRFDIGELFADDKAVRERVYSEAIRRTIKAPTEREREKIAGFGVWAADELAKRVQQAIDPLITIFQSTYSHEGWWGALGSYAIKVEPVGASDDGTRIFVKLSGSGDYEWAPDDASRSTQQLHELAQRLIELGKARPYKQIAQPRTFVVQVTKARLLDKDSGEELARLGDYTTQANPKSDRLGHMLRVAYRRLSH
jgi:hypothetical protein